MRVRRSKLPLEDQMALVIRLGGLPEPERQYPLVTGRRFRADFAWPKERIALETEGGVFKGGPGGGAGESRHTAPLGYERDCLKYSLAAIEGWLVIRVTNRMVESGAALDLLTRAFAARREAA